MPSIIGTGTTFNFEEIQKHKYNILVMPVRKRAFIVASDIVAAESLKNK